MEENNKVFTWLEAKVLNPLGRISQFKVVRAIMGAGMATIPFTIVGSMFLVLTILPDTMPFLKGIFEASVFRVTDLYMTAYSASMGLLALYFCLVLGYEYTKIFAEEEELDLSPINGALLSLFAFLMTLPQLMIQDGKIVKVQEISDTAKIINGWAIGGDGPSRMGSIGIFTGIIMAVVAVQLYRLCVKKGWTIKMPEAVPLGVSRAFTALVPAFVVCFTVLILNGILVALGTDLFEIISLPFGFVANLTNSWLGLMVIYFLIHALWIVGIHGATIITSIIQPIVLNNFVLNAQGAHIPLAGEFNNAYVTVGGSGATLALTFFMVYLAKSEQLKVLGKAALVPALFNINEPLIFGIPLIYNPFMAIPFFLAPMTSASIAYFAIKLEYVRPIIAQMPWPSPVGVGAFIGSGGDIKAGLVAFLCVAAAGVIYLPFFLKYDKRLVDQERANALELGLEEA